VDCPAAQENPFPGRYRPVELATFAMNAMSSAADPKRTNSPAAGRKKK